MGDKKGKVLSIIGSPSTETSNTRALVEYLVSSAGESFGELSHEIIMLGEKSIKCCKEC